MSIVITNITEKENYGVYGKGLQLYKININGHLICKFNHVHEDGLAKCLERASCAVSQKVNKRFFNNRNKLLKVFEEEIWETWKRF